MWRVQVGVLQKIFFTWRDVAEILFAKYFSRGAMLLKYFLPMTIFIRCAPGWSGPACDCKVYHFKTDILILILNICASSYIEPGGWKQLRGPGYWPHLRWARPVRLWGAPVFYISHLIAVMINCSEYAFCSDYVSFSSFDFNMKACKCSDDGYSGRHCSACPVCPDQCESLRLTSFPSVII